MSKRKRLTWGDIFYGCLAKGWDHGYAAYAADKWEAATTAPLPNHHLMIVTARSHMRAAEGALHVGQYEDALAWINRAGYVVTELKELADAT